MASARDQLATTCPDIVFIPYDFAAAQQTYLPPHFTQQQPYFQPHFTQQAYLPLLQTTQQPSAPYIYTQPAPLPVSPQPLPSSSSTPALQPAYFATRREQVQQREQSKCLVNKLM